MTTGRTILTLIALTTSFGGFLADWNHTHVYNPNWPPHAKFHNGQTMSTGFLLGFTALYYIYRKPTTAMPSPASSSQPSSGIFSADSLHLVVWLLSLNWVAQLSAVAYPGALPTDPEFGEGFPQLGICAVLFVGIGVGYVLEKRRLVGEGRWDDGVVD